MSTDNDDDDDEDDDDEEDAYACSACVVCICQNHALIPILLPRAIRLYVRRKSKKVPRQTFHDLAICFVSKEQLNLISNSHQV